MAGDQYWNNVVLAMHMDDATLTDVKGHAITLNGTAARSAARYAPLTGNAYSALFDGSAGGFLSVPYSTDFNFGTGDFNVRAWVYIGADSTANTGDSLRQASICAFGYPSTANSWAFVVDGSTTVTGTGLIFTAWVSGTQHNAKSSTSISKGAWHLLEAKRISGVMSLAVDGTNQTLTTNALTTQNITGAASNLLRIGNLGLTGYEGRLNGNVDDLLITRTGRPTELPTAPFIDHMVRVSGIVEDLVGAPIAKPVHVHRKSDGALAGTATSDAGTGVFVIDALDATAHYATCVFSSTEPAKIFHDIIPV